MLRLWALQAYETPILQPPKQQRRPPVIVCRSRHLLVTVRTVSCLTHISFQPPHADMYPKLKFGGAAGGSDGGAGGGGGANASVATAAVVAAVTVHALPTLRVERKVAAAHCAAGAASLLNFGRFG